MADTHKVVIEVELTDEDLAAASHAMFGPWDGAPKLDAQAVKEHFLDGAVQRQLHLMRSAKKWKDCNGYEALPKSEEGRTMTEVEDEEGRVHQVMLPNGTMWRPQVLRPVEGSWECEGSPTKTCWYDDQRDPAWDRCLFCGDPDERK
jgi:hypothetical protein